MSGGTGRVAMAASIAVVLTGCGLVLDLDPPDPQDAGVSRDAARTDGARRDAGPLPPCVTDAECDDGDACNGLERCGESGCVPGESVECIDDDPCDGTISCVDGECVMTGEAPACPDDGDPCNGEELCIPGEGCGSGAEPDCDDGVACTVDSCDLEGCRNTPDDTLCTDGPEGVCDATLGCQYSVCDSTTCLPGPCQVAACESSTCVRTTTCASSETCCAGSCVPAGCDDDNPCTDDHCDVGAGGCAHDFNTDPCDDGDACTALDRCSGGVCESSVRIACSDGDPCTVEYCDAALGCVTEDAPEGTACNDGDACTKYDSCMGGLCTAGVSVSCDDGEKCTTNSCDATSGCVFTPHASGDSCGMNAVCDTTGSCVCDAGWLDCNDDFDCECAAATGCDGGGLCYDLPSCRSDADCGGGSACCLEPTAPYYQVCFDPMCLSCCMGSAG